MKSPKTDIRETEIAMRHIREFKVTHLSGRDKVLAHVKGFNQDAEKAPESASVITFLATRVDHNGDRRVKPLGKQGAPARAQMKMIDYATQTATEATPVSFEMLVIPMNKTCVSDLDRLERALHFLIPLETNHDPLEFFFKANQQTLKQRT